MRVLVISAAFPPMRAGEADHTFYLCKHLTNRGLDVHVLTTNRTCVITNLPFKVYPIMQNWSWIELPRLVRFLKSCSSEAVLLYYIGWVYNDHPMITFAPTISRALLGRVPFVTQFANAEGSNPCSFSTRFLRKIVESWAGAEEVDYSFGTLLRDSDRIIVLSECHQARLSLCSASVDKKAVLIPPPPLMHICPEDNGASRKRGREALSVKPNEFLIAYLGYIYPPKGIETLLKAFQIVSTQRCHVRMVLIGGIVAREYPDRPSYAQELKELSKQLGIDDKVIWTGEYLWNNDEASVYLRAADICVFPFNVGVQLNNSSFASATAHGLPIITTQSKMLEQPFIHEENVLLCPPKSPEAMANAIIRVIDNPELREHLRVGSLTLSQEWFSWEKAIDRTIATFL